MSLDLAEPRDSQAVDQAAAGAIGDGLIVLNQTGEILSFNVAAERLFGYRPEEVIGKTIRLLMPGASYGDGDLSFSAETRERGIIGIGRAASARRKDGAAFPIEWSLHELRIGGEDLWLGIIRDISDRRRVESSLADEAAWFTAIMNTVVDGLITIDATGCIDNFNPAAERIFGYSAEEAKGRNVKMLMPEPYHSEHDGYINNHLETGEKKIIGSGREVVARRRDGSVFPMELAVGRMSVSGQVMFVGIIRDISERQAANDVREKLIAALSRSNAELDEFAYIASHDLKEPLRGLYNHALFLSEDYAGTLDADGVSRLQRMGVLCQRMERIIDSLLYYSRLGRQERAVGPTDLYGVVDDVISLMTETIIQENVTIQVETPLPKIECDSVRVREVFLNLIANAIKYNEKETKLVKVGMLNTYQNHKDVFYVADNGIGIDNLYLEEVFRMFRRLNSEQDDKKGVGAGLTFVKKIVERHGGCVWAESTPGVGSRFFFTLKGPET